MSKFSEPTTSLEDQLRIVSQFDEADDEAALAKALNYAGIALRFLEAFGFPRPYVYPTPEGHVQAEWPGEWDVALRIQGDARFWGFARKEGEPLRTQWFEGEGFLPAICDFMHPVLTFKTTGHEGRLATLLGGGS